MFEHLILYCLCAVVSIFLISCVLVASLIFIGMMGAVAIAISEAGKDQ